MDVHAVKTAWVEVADGNGEASAHQHGVVADVGKVTLATETVRSIGRRAIRCQIELEVVIGVAIALQES